MITIAEALERILEYVQVLPPEHKHPVEAMGQVLAEDVVATFDIPPMDNTAMDGYAVVASDTESASAEAPIELRVIGQVAAGQVYDGEKMAPGTAVRIMTGAPIPAGADAVVPFEETDEGSDESSSPDSVRVYKATKLGANVRKAAEDVRAGETVVRAGTVLRPQEIGVIASVGVASVSVIRRPVVAVLSTGDELVEPGEPRSGPQIYDANACSVASLARRFGGEPRLLGIAPDTRDALTAKLAEARAADMVVTSAGVSRGDFDIVKDVLAEEGEIGFWTVAMKPGKPLAFGAFRDGDRVIPHLGLPGNPVSAMVAFEIFGRVAILKMMGKTDFRRPFLKAITEERIENRDDPRLYLARCVLSERDGQHYIRLSGEQGSNILTSMMKANALTVIPPGVDVVEAGEEVLVMMLDWSRGEDDGSFYSDESDPWN